MKRRLKYNYYTSDALTIAKDLLGKTIVREFEDGTILKTKITETEAYVGEQDLASHASRGKTPRTQIMYGKAGHIYMYFIYGMYWMLNVVTGEENMPHAVLIRGIEGTNGPGRVAKVLQLDKSFYGEDLTTSKRIWIEDTRLPKDTKIISTTRIGVSYAKEWAQKPWRFFVRMN